MPNLGGPNLRCIVANKHKNNPQIDPSASEKAKVNSGGRKPPDHPPPPCLGVSTRQLPPRDG